MLVFSLIFVDLWNLVSFVFSPLRLSSLLLFRCFSLVSFDANIVLFLYRCLGGSPNCFIVCRYGGNVDLVADPLDFYRPMTFFFPPIIVDRGVYIVELGGLLFYLYFLEFSLHYRFRSSKPGFSLSVPSLLGGSAMEVQWFSSCQSCRSSR